MFQKEILANPDAAFGHCHCATIAIGADGDLVVAWYAYPREETRGAVLFLARRRSGGARFEKPRRILAAMNSSLGNPVLFFDANGRLHLLFVALSGHYWDSAVAQSCHSDDMGVSWSVPESLRLQKGIMVRHPPILRKNGYYLLPAYDEKTNQTVLLTAGPDAEGWMAVETFKESGAIQGCMVRNSDSELFLLLRPAGDRRICLRAISGDDGRSWSRVLPTSLPNPLSGLAGFSMGHNLCAVYNHTTEHRRTPLSLSWSNDRGTSWSAPVHIDESNFEVSYPSFVTDGRGNAHGVYTLGRNLIQYVRFDQAWWRR